MVKRSTLVWLTIAIWIASRPDAPTVDGLPLTIPLGGTLLTDCGTQAAQPGVRSRNV